jgi:phosphoserine phosphatase RsbU/P
MLETFSDSYNGTISAFVGCVEGNRLLVANAGHPYPVLFRANAGKVEEIKLNGFLLGIFDTVSFDSTSYEFNEGDCIVLYTDGIFDKGKENGFVGWDKVKNYCSKNIFGLLNDPEEYINNMLAYFSELDGNNFIDDAAIMLIKKL